MLHLPRQRPQYKESIGFAASVAHVSADQAGMPDMEWAGEVDHKCWTNPTTIQAGSVLYYGHVMDGEWDFRFDRVVVLGLTPQRVKFITATGYVSYAKADKLYQYHSSKEIT